MNVVTTSIPLLCLFSLSAEGTRKAECPPPQLTPSCKCAKQFQVTLNCYDLINTWDFVTVLHRLKDYDIEALYYQNLNIQFLPKGFLKFLPVKVLMLSESTILGFETEDGEEMFEGATESIESFNMHRIDGAKSWRWGALVSLKNLEILGVNSCDLTQITSDLGWLAKSLTVINFSGNKITDVDENAFNSYEKIRIVDLLDNEISIIKRSMFPDPANSLKRLFLNKNKIKELPEDIFTNMPELRTLELSSNRIQWLSMITFDPVYRHLYELDLEDNNIYCCGELRWVINSAFQRILRGKCKSPTSLAGRDLSSLTETDLQHGLC